METFWLRKEEENKKTIEEKGFYEKLVFEKY